MTTRAELDTGLSQLFHWYNLARWDKRHRVSRAKLNKALGILQRTSTWRLGLGHLRVLESERSARRAGRDQPTEEYHPSVKGGCHCYDYQSHMQPITGAGGHTLLSTKRWWCCHRIAAAFEYRMETQQETTK